jgi:hypothetical protein
MKTGKLLGNDKHMGHLTFSDTLQLFLLHSLEHYGCHVQLAQLYGSSQGIFFIIQLVTIPTYPPTYPPAATCPILSHTSPDYAPDPTS